MPTTANGAVVRYNCIQKDRLHSTDVFDVNPCEVGWAARGAAALAATLIVLPEVDQHCVVHGTLSTRLRRIQACCNCIMRLRQHDVNDDESPFIHDSIQKLFTPWCMYTYSQPP